MRTPKLPPIEFSNAINDLYPEWNFSKWWESPEWRMFNAGKAVAFSDMALEAGGKFKDAKEMARRA